jgi:hypothetical protein
MTKVADSAREPSNQRYSTNLFINMFTRTLMMSAAQYVRTVCHAKIGIASLRKDNPSITRSTYRLVHKCRSTV